MVACSNTPHRPKGKCGHHIQTHRHTDTDTDTHTHTHTHTQTHTHTHTNTHTHIHTNTHTITIIIVINYYSSSAQQLGDELGRDSDNEVEGRYVMIELRWVITPLTHYCH